jgi:hypothetical protein
MSRLDEELKMLRVKLAALEEQKRIEQETAAEKRANPLKTLETILTQLREAIERNSYSKSVPLARFYDRQKVSYLEPIVEMLKQIQDRLDVLERKSTPS